MWLHKARRDDGHRQPCSGAESVHPPFCSSGEFVQNLWGDGQVVTRVWQAARRAWRLFAGTCRTRARTYRSAHAAACTARRRVATSSHTTLVCAQVKILAVTVCVLFAMLIAVTSTIPPVDDVKHRELARPASVAPAVFGSSDAPPAQLAQQGLQEDPQLATAPPTPQRPLEAGPAAGAAEPAHIPPVPLPAEGPGAQKEKELPGSATVVNILVSVWRGQGGGRADGRECSCRVVCV